MDIETLAKDLENKEFISDLLSVLVDRGFGTLPARETAISVLELILQKHPNWSKGLPADYELARLLRVSPRKIRGYLDEISYRDTSRTDAELRNELADTLANAERVSDGRMVMFEIDDGLLRDYARRLVRENAGVFESGISGSVIKISGEQFAALAIALLPEQERAAAIKAIQKEVAAASDANGRRKSLLRTALESFTSSAASQAGKKLVDLGFLAVTGGLSEVATIADAVHAVLAGESD